MTRDEQVGDRFERLLGAMLDSKIPPKENPPPKGRPPEKEKPGQ